LKDTWLLKWHDVKVEVDQKGNYSTRQADQLDISRQDLLEGQFMVIIKAELVKQLDERYKYKKKPKWCHILTM